MDDGTPPAVTAADGTSRFELAPPRRFVLPALLLLLSERPGYGYGLLPGLQEFHFGHVDRPAVYRALSQLERDGLVEMSSQSSRAGQSRRVYQITPLGERVLACWMGVIKEEHDRLGAVLRRYQSTGRPEAVLVEVVGGWATTLGPGWSPVSPSSAGRRRLVPLDPAADGAEAASTQAKPERAQEPTTPLARPFRLVPDRSVVMIEVRSTVGPLSFGTLGVSGHITAAVRDGVVLTDYQPSGRVTIDVSGLRSGNGLYDAELLRRIDARRFPTATLDLCSCTPSGRSFRYNLTGSFTFHGVTRPVEGTVSVEARADHHLTITGEQVFDIRDFAIPSPTVLMLRIFPDVRVRLQAEAELEDS